VKGGPRDYSGVAGARRIDRHSVTDKAVEALYGRCQSLWRNADGVCEIGDWVRAHQRAGILDQARIDRIGAVTLRSGSCASQLKWRPGMNGTPRRIIADGFVFPKGPRWYAGELWFSDIHAHAVMAVHPAGDSRVVARFDDRPSGLGFLPDGSLVVCLMRSKRVMLVRNHCVELFADLAEYPWHFTNDCVTDGRGRTHLGFRVDMFKRAPDAGRPLPHGIVLIEPDGRSRVVALDMAGPNGSVVSPDGRRLIVAETHAGLLTEFTIEEDGSLAGGRLFADTNPARADGICLDAEGAVWIASAAGFLRVRRGGEIADRIAVECDRHSVACALGGENRRRLFMLFFQMPSGFDLGRTTDPRDDVRSPLRGWIEATEVPVAGAGWP
jgi:sugar lactone lactonase YvrE